MTSQIDLYGQNWATYIILSSFGSSGSPINHDRALPVPVIFFIMIVRADKFTSFSLFPVKLFFPMKLFFFEIVTGTFRDNGHFFGIFFTGTFSVSRALFGPFLTKKVSRALSRALFPELSRALYLFSRALFAKVSRGGKSVTGKKKTLPLHGFPRLADHFFSSKSS